MNSSGASDSSSFVLMASLSAAGAFNTAGAITQNGSQVLHAGNYGSYALPLGGGTVTGLSVFNGKISLGSNASGTYNGNTGGLTINSTAEIRSLTAQNQPALTWHWEGIATRHLAIGIEWNHEFHLSNR